MWNTPPILYVMLRARRSESRTVCSLPTKAHTPPKQLTRPSGPGIRCHATNGFWTVMTQLWLFNAPGLGDQQRGSALFSTLRMQWTIQYETTQTVPPCASLYQCTCTHEKYPDLYLHNSRISLRSDF